MKLISACLLGVRCDWRGEGNENKHALKILRSEPLIPVCPEQLGGLRTPRTPHEIQGGSGGEVLDGKCEVLDKEGGNATQEFIRGATETLIIPQLYCVKEFIGRYTSPSCGVGRIYDGTFSERTVEGDGVTSALLQRNGVKVITEEDLIHLTR